MLKTFEKGRMGTTDCQNHPEIQWIITTKKNTEIQVEEPEPEMTAEAGNPTKGDDQGQGQGHQDTKAKKEETIIIMNIHDHGPHAGDIKHTTDIEVKKRSPTYIWLNLALHS